MNKTTRAHGSMVLSSLLVATSFPVVASISGLLDSALLTLLRFALASFIFYPLVFLRYRRAWLPSPIALLRYAFLSAPLVGFFVAMFEALRTSNSVNTGALFTLAPGFATLLAFFILGERISRARLAALFLALIGTLWVVFRGDYNALLSLNFVIGDAYFVAGTASLGVYVVMIKRIHRGEPMAIMTFWTLVSGTGWLTLLCWDKLLVLDPSTLDMKLLGAIFYLAVFTTLITFLLTQAAIVVLGPTRVMSYNYLNPTLVAVLVWALGDEALGWRSVPGVALTLIPMFILQRSDPVTKRSTTTTADKDPTAPPSSSSAAETSDRSN